MATMACAASRQPSNESCKFTYLAKVYSGDTGFLAWTAEAEGAWVEDGADSYVVAGGLIVAQTIHYSILSKAGAKQRGPSIGA
jgi:hypothetical protein